MGKRKYWSNAERQRAYRERLKRSRPAPACFDDALQKTRTNVTRRFKVIEASLDRSIGMYLVKLSCGHTVRAYAYRNKKTGSCVPPKTCYCWKC